MSRLLPSRDNVLKGNWNKEWAESLYLIVKIDVEFLRQHKNWRTVILEKKIYMGREREEGEAENKLYRKAESVVFYLRCAKTMVLSNTKM